jgi:acyl-lipid omega-6 desaturase (Delta-12 desaturase)
VSPGYQRSMMDGPVDSAEVASRPAVAAPPEPTIAAARAAVHEFRDKRNAYAVWLLFVDLGLFGAGQWLAVAGGHVALQALGAALTWLAIVRLFVIGHDACHQALTGSAALNAAMGRVAFLVSLTPYSLWRVGHNLVHHGFNSLRGRDFVWEPRQVDEYRAMSPARRRLERLYRGAGGPAAYYFLEMWWRRLFFPNRREMPTRRVEFLADSLLVAVAAVAWTGAVATLAQARGESVVVALLCAFVVPFVLWNWTMGLIVYLHHTHPDVPWHADRKSWQREGAQLSSTIHLVMPGPVGPLMHHIMEHPAHHLDATIPLYHLRAAQRRLRDIGARFRVQRFTLAHYLQTVRTCKLYDYQAGRWVPFPD